MMCCGFLGFPVLSFWLALYFQTVLGYSSLMTGVHMLPMAVVGLLANVVAALLLHRVSNKLLMGIGAVAYVVSFVLAAVQRHGDSYWAFSFPALCLCVVGADFQFNVSNVRITSGVLCSNTDKSRCTSSRPCPKTDSRLRARCSRRLRVSALLSGTALLRPFSMPWKPHRPRRATMPITPWRHSLPRFGLPLEPRPLESSSRRG